MVFVHWKYNSILVYNPSYPEIDHSVIKKCDWSEFYWNFDDTTVVITPECRGKEVDIQVFVNNDHSGDRISHRPRSGFFIYMNATLVQWFSKKHSTVETAVLVLSLLP